MDNGFYFAKEKNDDKVTIVYSSSSRQEILSDKTNDKREFEILTPVPDEITEMALKGKIRLLNMIKLTERMHE